MHHLAILKKSWPLIPKILNKQKTIESRWYKVKCAPWNKINSIKNKTILGDLFEVIDRVPKGIADLIIIDPPYNLSKDFNGFKFKSTSDSAYIDYLRTWFEKVLKVLKPNGSLYLCGDWKSTSALQINYFINILQVSS